MRNIFILLIGFCLSNGMVSCHYLDFDETSGAFYREDMYEYFNKASQMMTNVYTFIPQDYGDVGGAMRACAADDAEFGDPNGTIQNMTNGNWSAIKPVDTKWSLYNGVRAANEFIESIEEADFSRFENDPNYPNWMRKLAYFPYEARVLRAYYFFELARRYGDIAMPLTMLTIDEANTIKKTNFEHVVEFIVSECDSAKAVLPLNYQDEPDSELGRATRGFAMALKAKTLLYAASKLHNPTQDVEKWKRAAAAAKDVMDMNYYRLDEAGVFGSVESQEIIMLRMNNFSNYFERNNFPIRFTEGARSSISGTYPTQNLVDAFQTKNGYDVILTNNGWECEDPAFDLSNPYDRRDPRFARTVLANGMDFKGDKIEVFKGGADDFTVREGGTPTGYFIRKHITETTSFTPGSEVTNRHHWVMFRYAEILLSYAEAMVEAFDDPNYTDATFTKSAVSALNEVRANATMPAVMGGDKEQFIEHLRREWRVEFAFEDHRFWDIRRWCIGSQTTNIRGVEIERVNNQYSYKVKKNRKRVWNEKMNLYPIPQEELFNNTNLAPQNPGWN